MKKFLYAALSLLMLASCSDDPLKGSQNGLTVDDNTPGVYIGVNFQMPGGSGSRSTTDDPNDGQSTSTDGEEVGQDYENNVNEVLLILARKSDYGFIGAAKVQSDYIYKHSDNPETGTGGSYHANAKFEKSQLETHYNSSNFDPDDPTIAVFVVVNPNGGLQAYFEQMNPVYGNTAWINEAWKVSASTGEGAIWSTANGGNFLMTNSNIAIREIPKEYKYWDAFSKRDTPFNLSENNTIAGLDYQVDNSGTGRGAVKVQRACARLDFKDGSPKETDANTYHALYLQTKNGTDSEHPFIDIKLERMSLVNMNNKFYYFERVSDNGLPEQAKLCMPEKAWYTGITGDALFDPNGGNYVVDFYAQDKYKLMQGDYEKNLTGFKFSDYYEYPLFEDGGTINSANLGSQTRWGSSEIVDILDNEQDQNKDYYIWRYVTENVIPYTADPYPYFQPNALSTGIVFRGKMSAHALPSSTAFEDLTEAERERYQHVIDAINATDLNIGNDGATTDDFTWKNPILYMYAKKLYATWQDLCIAAVEASLSIRKENSNYIPDWNRTSSFYKAVFGNEKSLTGCTIVYDIAKGSYNVYLHGETLPAASDNLVFFNDYTDTSNKGMDETSANYAWLRWNENGKPDGSNNVTKTFKKAVTDAEITIYQRSQEDGEYGYFCYYYYWNRHNDNNRDGVMGPMEFCTVRNNVYKLSVTKITNLGHPRLDENDPDTPKPYDPDESSNVYITVDSKVIPWVVRVNNIEF